MAFENPRYTMSPNDLYDTHAPKMGEAELRITLALIRATFGWHREQFHISINQLIETTGLSRQGVVNGIAAVEKRGLFNRVVVPTGGQIASLWEVNKQQSRSLPTRLPGVYDVDPQESTSLTPGASPSIIYKETERKEKKKSTRASKKPTPEPPEATYTTSKGKIIRGLLCDWFEEFWKAYAYPKGKAQAADSFLALEWSAPLKTHGRQAPEDWTLYQKVIFGARKEAEGRQAILDRGSTPKWAQGWLTARRFDDYEITEKSDEDLCEDCGFEVGSDAWGTYHFNRKGGRSHEESLREAHQAL